MRWNCITDRDPHPCADPRDRGLHYGDGLFETLLMSDGVLLYGSAHFQRLIRDAARLGIPCPDESWLREALEPYREKGRKRILKLILTRGIADRGAAWPSDPQPSIYISEHPYNPNKQAVSAVFSKYSLPENPALAGIKHLNRLDYVLASRELSELEDTEQLILCAADGRVIETLVHNLFLVRDGEIRTPALDRCGVNGVMRGEVIKRLEQAGKAVRIDDCSRTDLLNADECFVCNSVQGIRALTRIGDRTLPVGPVTRNLQRIFDGH